MTIHDIYRKRLLDTVGMLSDKKLSLEEIRKTQWSDEFERLMRNRMVMGYFRYGALSIQNIGKYDNVGSMHNRLQLYEGTGNLEHLVDVANLCIVEYLLGNHPDKHFESIDDGVHTQAK